MIAPPASSARVESLDYLRGLLALAVMVYHYVSWSGHPPEAESLLGRLGIYAVSTFYVLSGLSLALVYRQRLVGLVALKQYAIHRIFRIAPLFWIAVTTSLLLQVSQSLLNGSGLPELDAWRIFLNYSLLFGFVQPDAYFSTGAWSIGNEMVFYAMFPFLIAAARRSRWLVPIALCVSLVVAGFLTHKIDENIPLVEQWSAYINPLNQLPFFISGMLVAEVGRRGARGSAARGIAMLATGSVLFALVPVNGEAVALVSAPTRAAFLVACTLVVAGVYHSNVLRRRDNHFGEVFTKLGLWTYSIYLLHPFTPVITTRLFGDGWMGYASAAVATILVSYTTFRWIEHPMMQTGKRLASRKLEQSTVVDPSR